MRRQVPSIDSEKNVDILSWVELTTIEIEDKKKDGIAQCNNGDHGLKGTKFRWNGKKDIRKIEGLNKKEWHKLEEIYV